MVCISIPDTFGSDLSSNQGPWPSIFYFYSLTLFRSSFNNIARYPLKENILMCLHLGLIGNFMFRFLTSLILRWVDYKSRTWVVLHSFIWIFLLCIALYTSISFPEWSSYTQYIPLYLTKHFISKNNSYENSRFVIIYNFSFCADLKLDTLEVLYFYWYNHTLCFSFYFLLLLTFLF